MPYYYRGDLRIGVRKGNEMKIMAKWKHIFCSIVIILVIIRIGYIIFQDNINKEFYWTTSYDLSAAEEVPCQNVTEVFQCKEEHLNSLEFIFNNIAEEKTGAITFWIWKEDTLIYQADLSLESIENKKWKKVFINAPMQRNVNYTLELNADGACMQIPTVLVVKNNAVSEIIDSYQEGEKIDGSIAINYGYLRIPGIYDKASVIFLWILFSIVVFCALFYFERIVFCVKKVIVYAQSKVKPEVLVSVLELLACNIIINCSGIEFQSLTKIILYIISLISIVQFDKKKLNVKELSNSLSKTVLLYFLYVYSAFALVGQRILIYPLDSKLTIAGLFIFVTTVLWFVPVINTFLYYLENAQRYCFTKESKIKTPVFVLVCSLILFIPLVLNLIAYNPGMSSKDTYDCMVTNAWNLHGMYDWHPAFYCMVLRAILSVSNSTYAVIAVQYFFWIYVINELLLFLRKKKMKDSILFFITVFIGINAGNFMHINTIWKDVPYTISLLWAFIILAKLSIDKEEYKKKWYIYLELIISLTGICLYRKNGVVSFILIAVMLVIVLRKNIKAWCSIAVAVALIFTIKGPVYDYFEIEDTGRHGIYIGLGQDILGVYYAGGEVSEDTMEMITMMTCYNNAEYSYTPTWADDSVSYDVDVTPAEFVANYLDTFVKNPVIMLRAIIDRGDALWGIFPGQDSVMKSVNYYGTMDGQESWNRHYPARKYISIYTEMSALTKYTADSQWISAIEWRSGLFTLLGLVSICYLIFKKGFKRHLLIISPLIGHVLSLVLSTGWSDFRYFWPMNLMNMAAILVVLVIVRQKYFVGKKEERHEFQEYKEGCCSCNGDSGGDGKYQHGAANGGYGGNGGTRNFGTGCP